MTKLLRLKKISHEDVELFLEAALGLYCGKVNKPDRLKVIIVLLTA
jgi:hypothetical protein